MEHRNKIVKKAAVGGLGDDTFPASVCRMISSSKFDRLMNATNSLRSDMQLRGVEHRTEGMKRTVMSRIGGGLRV
ncbi:MAG: hypothetical protein KHY44_10250 [Clostridiales bacterium]|nr:hypothetical protein [Clostridiales bacterium]